MKPILEIKNLSKKFRIHHEQKPYLSIRDSVSNLFKAKSGSDEDFWALKDINFDVMPGESIGIIGKNGAGKSTLLKILSKITPPTEGKIISRGRIASLLEVGTGFHPELTGRENIFLNGSILGMRKTEIRKNFDAIVDFSGVEKFLDTSLKHYSSGMQLRLAFAVAAFLENEILVIDEVLAVGDAEFQKKCMGKMEEVSKQEGRTVLFVSHNLGVLAILCKKSILLEHGKLTTYDLSEKVIETYLKSAESTENKFIRNIIPQHKKEAIISEIETLTLNRYCSKIFLFNESISIRIKVEFFQFIPGTVLAVAMLDKMGNKIFTNIYEIRRKESTQIFYLTLEPGLIAPNSYSFYCSLFIPNTKVIDIVEHVCRINIIDSGSELAKFEGIDYGNIIMKANWEIE